MTFDADDGNAASHAKVDVNSAVRLLEKADTLPLLEKVWKSLTPAEREAVGKSRLEKLKVKLSVVPL